MHDAWYGFFIAYFQIHESIGGAYVLLEKGNQKQKEGEFTIKKNESTILVVQRDYAESKRLCLDQHDMIEFSLCGTKKLRQELMAYFADQIKELTGGSDLIKDCVLDEIKPVGQCYQRKNEDEEHKCK